MAQVTYTVVKGDTLSGIARNYNTTVSAIVKLNPSIKDPNKIYVGQTLVISGTAATENKNVSNKANVDYFALVADTDREVYAGWTFDRPDVDHYEYIWYYSWGVGQAPEIKGTTEYKYCTQSFPEYATHVSFIVKPVAKKKKDAKGNEYAPWTTEWSSRKTYYFDENPPKKPGVPSVEIKDYTLTATLENVDNLNATYIQFQVVQDNDNDVFDQSKGIKIETAYASYSCTIEPGHDYKVRARSVRGDEYSEWSEYSGNNVTKPGASSGITTCRATTSTSVYLEWGSVSNADTYEIEYATKREYLEGSNQSQSVSGIKTTSYTLTGLQSGEEYFFRVRAVNGQGESAWSGISSLVLGKKPSPPTTWSSTTTAISGEPLYLYWVHNSEDGSKLEKSKLELDINGKVTEQEITQPPKNDEEDEDVTNSYVFNTSGYTEGVTVKWRVKTCGITGEYSDWSLRRNIDIYGPPTLAINVTDVNGQLVDSLSSFPFRITGAAGPATQKPIGYHISILANESHETVDQIGNPRYVKKGTEVYSKYLDITDNLDVTLSANDVDLANNIPYTITCTVTMDSGLSTEATWNFTVTWEELLYVPNAEIGIDKETYSVVLRPYCEDENGELIEDVTLAVYRRTYKGSFVKIADNLENTKATYVVDPHPELDYARYRVIATTRSTGAVCYGDLGSYPVGGIAAIIQWDETWSNYDITKDGLVTEERPWSGSMLKLLYNIDVAPSYETDVTHVEYIGREHPVSYYGTQLGETDVWNTDVPATDKETLYALRRLANWMGNCYVREPSGTGYWASVKVSMNIKHNALVVPVALTITRVEGGV